MLGGVYFRDMHRLSSACLCYIQEAWSKEKELLSLLFQQQSFIFFLSQSTLCRHIPRSFFFFSLSCCAVSAEISQQMLKRLNIHGHQTMSPTDFGDPLTLILAQP